MKRLKLLTIMAATVVVSASIYTTQAFAADMNNENLELSNVKSTTPAAVTLLTSDTTKVNLELSSVQSSVSSNTIGATFKITNTGSETINLSDVKIKYYFTKDSNTEQEFHCYNADISNPYRSLTSNVNGQFVKMDTAMVGADSYLEISFDSSAGTLAPGETANIQSAFNKKDWTNYDQSNDYSFNDADKTVILIDGTVVSGVEPSTTAPKDPTTPTDPTIPVNPGTPGNADVEVSVSNGSSANSITPVFTVTNTSTADLDLTTLKLNYYYTADGSEAQNFQCYYAGTTNKDYKALTSYVVGQINTLDPATSTADTRLQVGFTGGTLSAGQTMTIQANVNKDGWTNYDQSNDYSYNTGSNVTADINDVNVWGTAPTNIVSATISPKTVEVDLNKLSYLTINMTLNDATFTKIADLTEGTDYTVNGSVVVISKDYLAKLPTGTKTLTFDMNQGTDPKLTLNITDSTINSTITPITGTYDQENKTDINIDMTLNGNTLVGIKNGVTPLVQGTDYTVNGTTVTLTKAYLDTLPVGNTALTFDFSKGNDPTFTINVVGKFEGLAINLPDVSGNVGDTIKIPVSLKGITPDGLLGCNFKLKYDTTLFESPTITAGDTCINPAKTLVNSINKDTGILSISYADSTGTGSEAIASDGVFVNINLKIKDTAVKNTTSKLTVTKAGTFADKNSKKYALKYNIGTITIGNGNSDPTPDPTPIVDSVLDTTSVNFDLTTPAAVTVGMTLNGNKLTEIRNGDKVLSRGTDYSVDGTTVTISKDYLSTLPVGSTSLTFDFSGGNDPKLTVNVKNSSEKLDSVIDTKNANFDATAPAAVTVGVTYNGNTLAAIKNGDAILREGTDYTVDGKTVTISKDYLSTLPVGSTSLTFDFSDGADPILVINATGVPSGVTTSIGKVDAKVGETVALPITLKGAPKAGIASFGFRIKYDPSVLEAAGVTAGSAITNPDLNFLSSISADKGVIYVQFVDYNVTQEDLIKAAGELANIKFKVKDTAKPGTAAITFTNDDKSFYDLDYNDLGVQFADGSINIK